MIKKDELAKMKIAELKTLANDKKVNVPAKATKDEIIKLILASEEVTKTAEKVKETLTDNPSSTTAAPAEAPKPQKQDFFQNTPELPQSYNKDKLVLMVRDPFWGFDYWEVSDNTRNNNGLNDKNLVLRMYDITVSGNANSPDSYFDIQLNHEAGNWYIKFPAPNHSFIADYGYIGQDGNFVTILRSNAVTTPREDVSDQVDEEWMMTDDQFKKILQASGANQMFEQIGSQELVKFLSNNVESTKNVDVNAAANTSALLSAVATSSMFAGSSSSSPMSGFSK
jgi:hypothetical protein